MPSPAKRVGILQPIFNEEVLEIVTRERICTSRPVLAMAMLLISVRDTWHNNKAAQFAGIANALSAMRSDIDIVGWFERGAIMGLIVPEIAPENLAGTCRKLESEFRKEIMSRFGENITEDLSIKICIYPEVRQVGNDEFPGCSKDTNRPGVANVSDVGV